MKFLAHDNHSSAKGILKKKDEVNVMKTKIMVFRKDRGRRKKTNWKWEEKVREIKYLGYTFQTNNRQEGHVRNRIKKATRIAGQVWGIGKRKFGKDIGKRI